ncbi:hypothetical protein [Polaromonas sp.]|uniref:hypothetical protein n=1 Tax=Polaromonas sp. TaxID=1869339 RepID=UPI0025CDBC43|nr:hypothetical protein [Polaromonas sp.]
MTARQGYMVSATGLLPSLKLLSLSGPEHLRANVLVGGFILECSLKAFITYKRTSQPQLYGHDLEALWRDAAVEGLEIDRNPPAWCVALNSLHFENKEDATDRRTKGGGKNDAKFKYPLRYQSAHHGLSFPVTVHMLEGISSVSQTVELALKPT